jgi:hypothetical protein
LWNIHAALELSFFIWYLYHKNALNTAKATSDEYEYFGLDRQEFNPEATLEENIRFYDDLLRGVGDKYTLRREEIVKWFCDAKGNKPGKLEEVRETDIKSWLAWAFFRKDYYRRAEEVEEECGEELGRMVRMVEGWINYKVRGYHSIVTPFSAPLSLSPLIAVPPRKEPGRNSDSPQSR